MARFRFRYTIFNVQAELGPEQLLVRMGIKTISLSVARLTHLYVHAPRGADHVELLLGYTKRSAGRIHRARVFADREQPGFEGLLDALLERRPEVDIRGVSRSEAFRQMGAVEAESVVIPGVMALGTLVVGLFFGPMLIHGADTAPPARVTLAELAAGARPGTRNVRITEVELTDDVVHSGHEQSRPTVWVPLVPRGGAFEEIRVLLELDASRPEQLERARAATELTGVLRDVWWEPLAQKQRNLIFRATSRPLAPDVLRVELEADRRGELILALGVIGFLALCTALVFVVMRAGRVNKRRGGASKA